ncbi:MAG: archaetidylserine decarboxylase [Proteobacteria bacterium]|nr:archaetidylserine decarboxylase [Pseudomonadota bacterium]
MKFIALIFQYILPHRFLSRLVYFIMRIKFKPFKNFVIKRMIKAFGINVDEAASSNFNDYAHFNAFFTRKLKANAREINPEPLNIISPVDGVISQVGTIENHRIFQAKGHSFTTSELLASDANENYQNGSFITIYLSPKDYHRIHAPLDCKIKNMTHIPGRLFSVANWTAQMIPRLFARNERLVNYIETEIGIIAYVYVGAILVSSIETVSNGLITPPYGAKVTELLPRTKSSYKKGEEMARFNMGSTVILLFPENSIEFNAQIKAGSPLKLGEVIAKINKK